MVESGEAVGGQGESGAPGFVFERPDPVSGHPDCEAGGEDGIGGGGASGETDAEQSLEDCDRAREAGDDRSESPDQRVATAMIAAIAMRLSSFSWMNATDTEAPIN